MSALNLFRSLQNRLPICRVIGALLLGISVASAHYCGPPVIRCKPGDVVTYYIISDMSEVGDSLYSVLFQDDPSVAPLVYFTPVARIAGQYVFLAQQPGANGVDLAWSFPPNSASGFCLLDIRVSAQRIRTGGDNPFSVTYGDPVNMLTGELIFTEPPDLNLGGPMPLLFRRYYASRLQADASVNSRLGDNWSHNFDWRAILVVTNKAIIISPEGMQVTFNKSGTNWTLQSPATFPFQLVNSGSDVVFGDPRDQRLFTFNTNGLLTAIRDGKGNTHTLTYTNDILLTSVTDGLGRSLSFTYAGPRFLKTVTDGTRTVTFNQIEFGNDFNFLSATDPMGRVTSYAYDNSREVGSLITARTYPLGNVDYAQTYDNDGRVVQQTRFGTNLTVFTYNTNTFTTVASNALGQVTTFTHSSAGVIASLTDPSGHSFSFNTNAAGRPNVITDRNGGASRAAFDPASGRPSAFTNANGAVTRFTYTNRTIAGITFYALSSVTMPDGAVEQFTYDAAGNLIRHTDPAGKQSQMAYNARGQLTGTTNPAGGVLVQTYNPDGTQATQTDADTGTATFTYDSLRRLTNATASDGRSLRLTLNPVDRILSVTDERTNSTFYTYDNNNRMTALTNAAGRATVFNYDIGSRPIGVTDTLARRASYVFDGLDQLTAVTNRNNNRHTFGYDSRQRFTSVTDPAAKVWSTGYDEEAAPVSFTDPLGNTIRHKLDPAGYITAITNPAGHTVSLQRDPLHRVTSTTDPLGRFNQYRHDPRGLLTNTLFSAVGGAGYEMNDLGLLSRLTDQTGSQWRFNYTPLGRLSNIIDPLNRTNTVTHDGRGRPQRLAFADGSSLTNGYDATGNLNRLDGSGGPNLTFDFDALHRLTNAFGLAFAFDSESRVTNTVSSGVNFGAAYDPGGRVTNVTYNGGALRVTYAYDSRDRLTQVRDNLTTAQLDFFYDDAGRLTNTVRANAIDGLYNYDPAGRLTRIREGMFIDLQYTLNAAGEIAALNSTSLLPAAPNAGQTNNFTFDAAHQVSTAGYAYDARGRLTTSPGRTFAWNAASQLLRAGASTNTYNGAGNLLTRATLGTTTRFHYNHALPGAPIVAEQDVSSAQFLRYYVWSPVGRLLYFIDAANGNAVSYYHFDRTGSTLALTSEGGGITDAYSYSPYGLLVNRAGTSPQPFTYVGRYGVRYDSPSGLYQMRARYYDPITARFLSRDPVWPRPSDALSLNPYNYAANNPLLYIDPSGGIPESQVLIDARLLEVNGFRRPDEFVAEWMKKPLPSVATGGDQEPDPGTPELLPTRNLFGTVRSPALVNSIALVAALMNVESRYILQRQLMLYTQPQTVHGMIGSGGGSPMPGASAQATPRTSFSSAQPFALANPLNIMSLGLECLGVNAYAGMLQVRKLTSPYGAHSPMAIYLALTTGIHPDRLEPLGVAFVNGERVHPKLTDIMESLYWYEDFYDDLYFDYGPGEVSEILTRNWLRMGGTGGIMQSLALRAYLQAE